MRNPAVMCGLFQVCRIIGGNLDILRHVPVLRGKGYGFTTGKMCAVSAYEDSAIHGSKIDTHVPGGLAGEDNLIGILYSSFRYYRIVVYIDIAA